MLIMDPSTIVQGLVYDVPATRAMGVCSRMSVPAPSSTLCFDGWLCGKSDSLCERSCSGAWADLVVADQTACKSSRVERHASLAWGPAALEDHEGSLRCKVPQTWTCSIDVPIEMWRFPTFHSGKEGGRNESPMYRLPGGLSPLESHLICGVET